MIQRILDAVTRPFGLRVVSAREADLFYLHKYDGAYEEYRKVQIHYNRKKLNRVWADRTTLDAIAAHIGARGRPVRGLCHGARNGWEVEHLRQATGADVIGTDISDTATRFPHMVVWDFHEPNPDWAGCMDFVYSNSLDQAMEPERALASWAGQLAPGGRVYIEHTMAHSPSDAGRMDPFGAHPMIMPYLFFTWGRGRYRLVDIIEVAAKDNNHRRAWVFVLAAEGTGPTPALVPAPAGAAA